MSSEKDLAAAVSPKAVANPQAAVRQTFLDLSQVAHRDKRMADPQLTIRYDQYVAEGSVLATREIAKAALGAGLSTPSPASLILHNDERSATRLYGVPTTETSEAYLPLEWQEGGQNVRANMLKVLLYKQITIPEGTRMVIKVRYIEHPMYGHCVELNWEGDCFVPIREEKREEKQSEKQATKQQAKAEEKPAEKPAAAPQPKAEQTDK